jgi:hypothetical protein
MEGFHVDLLPAVSGVGLVAGSRVAHHEIEVFEPLVLNLSLGIDVLQKPTLGEWPKRAGLQRHNPDVDVAQLAVFTWLENWAIYGRGSSLAFPAAAQRWAERASLIT